MVFIWCSMPQTISSSIAIFNESFIITSSSRVFLIICFPIFSPCVVISTTFPFLYLTRLSLSSLWSICTTDGCVTFRSLAIELTFISSLLSLMYHIAFRYISTCSDSAVQNVKLLSLFIIVLSLQSFGNNTLQIYATSACIWLIINFTCFLIPKFTKLIFHPAVLHDWNRKQYLEAREELNQWIPTMMRSELFPM